MTNNQNKPLQTSNLSRGGKISVLTPVSGSITLEAALAVPIFFLAVVCLIYLFEITAIKTSVRSGLQYAGTVIMEESYPLSVIHPSEIEEYVVNAIGAQRMNRSIIMGGSSGLDCSDSSMSIRTGIGTIKAEYRVNIPIPMFGLRGITCQDYIKIKAWTGYEKDFFGTEQEDTVYVTETGIVYHKDYQCTYLDLSIRMVSRDSISDIRNDSGGKYYPCTFCGGRGDAVYITDTGNKYHGSISCSGLKRTVYAIPLSEAVGKGACKRCG